MTLNAALARNFGVMESFMNQQVSTLYAKLLGETAAISWQELQPFFARGVLLWVDAKQDLVAVAESFAENHQAKVAGWLNDGTVARFSDELAESCCKGDLALWAVVVAPWVLVQECAEK